MTPPPRRSHHRQTAKGVACYHPGYTLVEKLQTVSTKFRPAAGEQGFAHRLMRHYYDVYILLLRRPEVQAFARRGVQDSQGAALPPGRRKPTSPERRVPSQPQRAPPTRRPTTSRAASIMLAGHLSRTSSRPFAEMAPRAVKVEASRDRQLSLYSSHNWPAVYLGEPRTQPEIFAGRPKTQQFQKVPVLSENFLGCWSG